MKSSLERALAFSLLGATLIAPVGAVESKEEESSLAALREVTVTATKTPIKVEEVPANVGIVLGEDIQARGSATDAYKAISHMAGVDVSGGHMTESGDIFIRGKIPSILSNGRDMNFFSGWASDPFISMSSIERIEVIKGPQAAIHGAKATSGVVNIIRKKGDINHPFIETGVYAGTGKDRGANLTLGGGVRLKNDAGGGELLTYFLDLNTDKKDEFKTPKGTIPYTDKNQKNIFARLDYSFANTHEISLDFTKDKSDKTHGGYGAYYIQSSSNKIINNVVDTQSTFVTYEGKMDERFSLHSNVGYTKRSVDKTHGDPNTEPENFLKKKVRNIYTEKVLQGEIRATANWLEDEKLRSIAGLQYKKVDIQRRLTVFGEVLFKEFDYDKTEKNISPFAQIEAKPTPYALFVAGIRHDSYDSAGKKMKATSPNLGISFFPFANTDHNYTTLWAGYSEAFNTPITPQRHSPEHLGGNPNLNPEKAKGYEVGIKQRIAHWGNVELGYYHTDYTDQIRLIKLPSNNWLYYNEGKSKVKGFELSSEFYPTPWLIINMAYVNSTTKDGEGKRLYGKVDKSLKYGAKITNLAGFDFSIWANQPLDLKLSDGGAHPSQKKTIIDAKLSYRYEAGRFVFTPYVSVENLTDKLYYSHDDGGGSISEGRNFRVGANARYNF